MRTTWRWLAAAAALSALGGCGDSGEPQGSGGATTNTGGGGHGGEGGAGAGGSGGGGAPAVTFGKCPAGYADECTKLEVPLDHEKSGGETIDFHVARRRAKDKTKRQIWLLAGGPGQAGAVYTTLLDDLAKRMPDADFYVVDHRGTGYSHRLTCSAQDKANTTGGYYLDPAGVPGCLDELEKSGDYDRLAHFTTREAAADVLDGIAAMRAPDQKVFVWGGSYGTHWAHRILQLAPTGVDGFVFDGFMTPNHFSFVEYDHGIEEVGQAFAKACDADAGCAAHLGAPALTALHDLYAQLDAKPCDGFSGDLARTWVSLLLEGTGTREMAMPLVHRLGRCSADDVTTVNFMLNAVLKALADDSPFINSGVLQYNIALSELWTRPGEDEPTKDALTAAAEAQTFLVGTSYPASIFDLRKIWPLPPADATKLPVPVPTKSPLLWLAGGMDSRTPVSETSLIPTLYPKAPFITLAGAVHTPSLGSPLESDTHDYCGLHVISSFIESGKPDTSCESDLFPVAFSAPTAAFATMWWNTDDDWGDGTPAPDLEGAPSPAIRLHLRPEQAPALAKLRAKLGLGP